MKCKRCGKEDPWAWGCCLGCLGEIVAEWEERQDEPIEMEGTDAKKETGQ